MSDLSTLAITSLLLILTYPLVRCTYNVYLHPLSKFPGPVTWSATRLPFLRSFMSGWIHRDVRDLHTRYGKVVRIAPNELSFMTVDSWSDIYTSGGDSRRLAFPKPAVWFAPQQGRPISVHTALDPKVHARMRRAMDAGFTERAVFRQEPLLQHYTSLMVQRLREHAVAKSTGDLTVNIIEWFNFVTFDLIGDLGFGESFGCLETTQYHPWMSTMFSVIRVAVSIGSLRHYPVLFNLLMSIVPKSARKMDAEHWQFAADKTKRRLDLDTDREDFLSFFQRKSKDDEGTDGLSEQETLANAHFITIAGTDTTVTVLTGIVNHLLGRPDVLDRLTNELRSTFGSDADMTLTKLRSLPYLNAVIEEGLRLCHPVPAGTVDSRITPKEGGQVSGYYVPGNTLVSSWIYAMNLSEEYFHEPGVFHPERWLSESQTDPNSPFYKDIRKASQPFGMGLRTCLGQSIAWAEMRLGLAKLIWGFELRRADTPAGTVVWDDQRVFGVTEKKPFDVILVDRQRTAP